MFRVVLYGCAGLILAIIIAIAGRLLFDGSHAIASNGLHIVTSDHWDPRAPRHPSYGLLGVLEGSLLIAALSLVAAVPVSIATALMINYYAPRKLRGTLTALVDLLAALPSIIYGLWGLRLLSPDLTGTSRWLSHHADFIPLFRDPQDVYGQSIFVCAVVVAVMILPIITSISREVMAQTPADVREAALALGGTRWGTITDVVLPFSRNGIVGGALLGLGRALGETIAVLLILSSSNHLTAHILQPNAGGSVAALIASEFTSDPAGGKSALILGGLLLFTSTLAVNLAARLIIGRGRRKR